MSPRCVNSACRISPHPSARSAPSPGLPAAAGTTRLPFRPARSHLTSGPAAVIAEYRAKPLLAPLGVAFPAGRFVTSLTAAGAAADAVGYPVAIKAQAAALPHKSDAGGVVLGLADAAALADGWRRLHADVGTRAAGVVIDGILVEAMGRRGTELIVGARNDPEWGPVILVGFGGIQAEILHDVQLIPASATRFAVIAALRRLKSAAILDGYRGSPALDVGAVADIVAVLGRVLAGTPSIREIDLNPVIVYPAGEGAVALDALIMADC